MSIIQFGDYVEGINYKVVDERKMRASAGIMFILGLIAIINAVFKQQFIIIPYVAGFMMVSFGVGIFINPKYSPAGIIAGLIIRKQAPLYIGAIQKKFAWSLGFIISTITFILSLYLQNDVTLFEPVCLLCLICMVLMYLETAFGICVGCKLYFLSIRLKLLKQPTEKPNCMGDSCDVK